MTGLSAARSQRVIAQRIAWAIVRVDRAVAALHVAAPHLSRGPSTLQALEGARRRLRRCIRWEPGKGWVLTGR